MNQIRQTEMQLPAASASISRFTIVLLGAVLIGMGAGRQLGDQVAELCSLIGLFSVACYLSLEAAARSRRRHRAITLQRSAEYRLTGQKQWHRLMRFCRATTPSRRELAIPMLTSS
jgi:hypothetical protein